MFIYTIMLQFDISAVADLDNNDLYLLWQWKHYEMKFDENIWEKLDNDRSNELRHEFFPEKYTENPWCYLSMSSDCGDMITRSFYIDESDKESMSFKAENIVRIFKDEWSKWAIYIVHKRRCWVIVETSIKYITSLEKRDDVLAYILETDHRLIDSENIW